MKSLQNFLCCMPLEIGGHVIGWYTILTNILWIIVAYLIMFEDIVDHKIIDKDTSTIIFIFILTFSVTLAIVGYLCIKGTRERNHYLILPVMIIIIIFDTLCFELASVLSRNKIFAYTLGANVAINSYFSFVLYALFEKFKNDGKYVTALPN